MHHVDDWFYLEWGVLNRTSVSVVEVGVIQRRASVTNCKVPGMCLQVDTPESLPTSQGECTGSTFQNFAEGED
jgi:hypothetical protein